MPAAAKRNYGGELQASLNVWNDGLEQIMTDIESIGIDTAILKPLKELMDKTGFEIKQYWLDTNKHYGLFLVSKK